MHLLMDFFNNYILHFDQSLLHLISVYHQGIYALLFAIVFVETGIVIMPFLPGDSLLFAVGSLASQGILEIKWLIPLLFFSSLCGDITNYLFGKFLGVKIKPHLNQNHINEAENYFAKYGERTIVLARFIPIIRTFAPFTAGLSQMKFSKFISFSALASFLWIGLFVPLGYFLGQIPFIKSNLKYLMLMIIVGSLLPVVIKILWKKKATKIASVL